jgi:hypothetical protein
LGLVTAGVLSDIYGTGTLDGIVYIVVSVVGLLAIPRLLGAGPHPRGA